MSISLMAGRMHSGKKWPIVLLVNVNWSRLGSELQEAVHTAYSSSSTDGKECNVRKIWGFHGGDYVDQKKLRGP
jgi:hypothetical protein